MHYDSLIFVLSLLAASFLFGRFFSQNPSGASNASRLREHNDSAVKTAEESPLALAIKTLIQRNDLSETLAADTTTIPGQLIWTRTLIDKTRGIRFAPADPPQAEYVLIYFEKDGDRVADGKWLWDLEHSVSAFSRFLIDWEDRRNISEDNVDYLEQQVKAIQQSTG
jgi:hypothetical protein